MGTGTAVNMEGERGSEFSFGVGLTCDTMEWNGRFVSTREVSILGRRCQYEGRGQQEGRGVTMREVSVRGRRYHYEGGVGSKEEVSVQGRGCQYKGGSVSTREGVSVQGRRCDYEGRGGSTREGTLDTHQCNVRSGAEDTGLCYFPSRAWRPLRCVLVPNVS